MDKTVSRVLAGDFRWTAGPPLIAQADRPDDPCHSIKDPSVVFHDGRWHVFCTIRSQKRTHQIEYLSFTDWKDAGKADRHVLALTDGYFCAPQVFYYSPHRRWYLLYQIIDKSRQPALQPAYSTTETLGDPTSWTAPRLLFDVSPEGIDKWIDFWVICDGERSHLFFTSPEGRLWRAQTRLADFPLGWSKPAVVLQADFYEASHTYRLKGVGKYLTMVEARIDGDRRYYKAFLADRLDGEWRPLAAEKDMPFASSSNVRQTGPRWTDSISHGELLRDGVDEKLEVDPARMRFLFQGVLDSERAGKKYGEIPWRMGLAEMDSM